MSLQSEAVEPEHPSPGSGAGAGVVAGAVAVAGAAAVAAAAAQAPDAPSIAAPAASGAQAGDGAPVRPSRSTLLPALAVLGITLALAAWQQTTVRSLRDELSASQRLSSERLAQVEQRLAGIEQQWASAQSDADPVGGLEPVVRDRREALAGVDIERLLELAQLELRSGAPNAVAADALAAADARLSRLGGAAARRVQAAVRRDLLRLRGAADVDVPAQAARVDVMLGQVASWPLLADAGRSGLHAPPAPPPAATTPAPPQAAGAVAGAGAGAGSRREEATGARVRAWFEREFGDLLRIRRVDTPEALLLDPVQQQLVRERVRLGLLAIRQGLLSRNEKMVQFEGQSLLGLLRQFFDRSHPDVDSALAQVRSLMAEASSATAPSLEESLHAVRELHPVRAETP
jgi:uroporphyrin-3 C-methyltransferase